MYQVLLAGWFQMTVTTSVPNASPSSDAPTLIGDAIYDIAPSARLRFAAIRLESPGPISFSGIGEPIEKLADGIERAYIRKETKQSARLDNEAKAVAVERERLALERDRMELERDRRKDELAVDFQRYETFKAVFLDLNGPDALATEAGREQFARYLSAQSVLEGLDARGKLSLAETTSTPSDSITPPASKTEPADGPS